MRKILKWVLIAGLGLGILLFAWYRYNLKQTKKHSPEQTIEYISNDLEIEVFYNRPYKKGREIFGGLVPFDEVWRTGANEATTFETNQSLSVQARSWRQASTPCGLFQARSNGRSFSIVKCIPGPWTGTANRGATRHKTY